ncbi:hypothetical protein A2954_02480 [Candidatus Roizmanbacteria bacterium RIFCSPLOWO2_01_FULL_37_12]|uniref:Uncharacterized protein n=1 Tax=Candidatus Roizmanbacteria bacterium RIFCSPLOWO2_01_FULL_37_12 TaxID=1802056 RepID=A0A1F7IEV6_9BACT|nr:MAG: hypothetical protein A2954_02480 [Candidatus Roizmanbacteria bacterium RIFCSPLOWO2_01_FULL_37_12]
MIFDSHSSIVQTKSQLDKKYIWLYSINMVQANPRIVFSEIKLPGDKETTSLMKWQRLGPDSKPVSTIYLKREFARGEDPLADKKIDEIVSELDIEIQLNMKETDPRSLSKQRDKLRQLQRFEDEQTVLQQQFNIEEEKQALRLLKEGSLPIS